MEIEILIYVIVKEVNIDRYLCNRVFIYIIVLLFRN
jgi:hypothetical protein